MKNSRSPFLYSLIVGLAVLSILMLAAAPAVFLAQDAPDELSDVQLFVIGTVASVLVWLVKFARSRGWDPSNTLLTNLVFVTSLIISALFARPLLPSFPPYVDLATFLPALLDYIGALLVPLTSMVGFAVLLYNILLKKVLDGLGNAVKQSIRKS